MRHVAWGTRPPRTSRASTSPPTSTSPQAAAAAAGLRVQNDAPPPPSAKAGKSEDDKPTIVALREIEEGLMTEEILNKTLEEDVLLDEFSLDRTKPKDDIVG